MNNDFTARIQSIEAYANRLEIERKMKEEKTRNTLEKYKIEIKSLGDRIRDIISTKDACLIRGISIPDKFYASGVTHLLGFHRQLTTCIGYSAGGYAGVWDLIVNSSGECKCARHQGTALYDIVNMEQAYKIGLVVADFDSFEKEFYTWVDELVSKN